MRTYKLKCIVSSALVVGQLAFAGPAYGYTNTKPIKNIKHNILSEGIIVAQRRMKKTKTNEQKIKERIAPLIKKLDEIQYTGLKKDKDYLDEKGRLGWLEENMGLLGHYKKYLDKFLAKKNYLGLKLLFIYASAQDYIESGTPFEKKIVNKVNGMINDASERIEKAAAKSTGKAVSKGVSRKVMRETIPKKTETEKTELIKKQKKELIEKLIDESFEPNDDQKKILDTINADELKDAAERKGMYTLYGRMYLALADYVKDGGKLSEVNFEIFYHAAILANKGERYYLFGDEYVRNGIKSYIDDKYIRLKDYVQDEDKKDKKSEKELFAEYLKYNLRHTIQEFSKLVFSKLVKHKEKVDNIEFFQTAITHIHDIYEQLDMIEYTDSYEDIKKKLDTMRSSVKERFGEDVSLEDVLKARVDLSNFRFEHMKADYENNRKSFDELIQLMEADYEINRESFENLIQLVNQSISSEFSEFSESSEEKKNEQLSSDLKSFLDKATFADVYTLGKFWSNCKYKNEYTAKILLQTILSVYKTDPYLVQYLGEYVFPTLNDVSNDDKEFSRLVTFFGVEFSRRASSTRSTASLLQRSYYINVFRKLKNELPNTLGAYDHKDLLYLLWEMPGWYENPDYYKVRTQRLLPKERLYIPEYNAFMQRFTLSLYPYITPIVDPGRLNLSSPLPVRPGAKEVFNYLNNLFYPQMLNYNLGVPTPYRIRRYNPDTLGRKIRQIFSDFAGVVYSGDFTSGMVEGGLYLNQDVWEVGAAGAVTTSTGGAEGEVIGGEVGGSKEVRGRLSAVRVPLGVQVHKSDTQFNYKEGDFIEGSIQSFVQIAKEQRKDMLVYVRGYDRLSEHNEEDNEEDKDWYKEGLYYIDKEGKSIRIAASQDDFNRILNYAFGEADWDKVFASLKAQHDLNDEYAFNGAAIGIDVGKYVSIAGIANLPKGIPKERYEKIGFGTAVSVKISKKPDIIVASVRGFMPKETEGKKAEEIYVGEVQWLRIPADKNATAHVARLIGGTGTVGGEFRIEWTGKEGWRYGLGITGGLETRNTIQNFPIIDDEAELYAQTVKDILVNTYGYGENEAEKEGWFLAGTYIYSQLSSIIENTDEKNRETEKHYAQALFMYWAGKHQILVGGEKRPWYSDYSDIRNELNNAYKNAQNNSAMANQYYKDAYNKIKSIMEKGDLWKFSIGWGWDGKVYVAGTYKGKEFANLRAIIAPSEDVLIDLFAQSYRYKGELMADMSGGIILRNIGGKFSLRFDLGPTLRLDLGKYKGFSGRALFKCTKCIKDNLDVIVGFVGGYKKFDAVELEQIKNAVELEQIEVIATGNVKNVSDEELSEHTFYIGFDWARKKAIIADEDEWEIWKFKAGYEWSRMKIDDKGISLFGDVAIGVFPPISLSPSRWTVTGQFGYKSGENLELSIVGGWQYPVIYGPDMWYPGILGVNPYGKGYFFGGQLLWRF